MNFTDIIALVEEKCDGRSFGIEKHQRWANLVRSEMARQSLAGGFHGLYFLYREATVVGGSKANDGKYQIPDDYIDDLSVWYDGRLLAKAPPGVMNVTSGENPSASASQPSWYCLRGREFDIIPAPPEAGKTIKLFYNGLLDDVSGLTFTDYFMTQWPHLHAFGMAESAADYMGASQLAGKFRGRFQEELQRLLMDNRRFWFKGTKMRYQNWDEFEEQKQHVFPQFGNLS